MGNGTTVQVGDRAPGFALPSGPGEELDVGALIGSEPVVLLFFPLAFSRVCTAEMEGFAARHAQLAGRGARVMAISVDSPFVVSKFRDEEELPFPVLSDFNREVSARYGVLYESFHGLQGVAKRAVFVIDGEGEVVYRWVADDAGREPEYGAVEAAVSGVTG